MVFELVLEAADFLYEQTVEERHLVQVLVSIQQIGERGGGEEHLNRGQRPTLVDLAQPLAENDLPRR